MAQHALYFEQTCFPVRYTVNYKLQTLSQPATVALKDLVHASRQFPNPRHVIGDPSKPRGLAQRT